MLYKKIENKVWDKKTPINYIGYIRAPFGPSKVPDVGFVEATVEDVKREYDFMVELQLKEESNLVWNKKKRKWIPKNDPKLRASKQSSR